MRTTSAIVIIILFIVTIFSCKINDSAQNMEKVESILGIKLKNATNFKLFEYYRVQGLNYPESIYISFNFEDTISIVNKLGLLSIKSFSNKDTSKLEEYQIIRLYGKSFWRLGSSVLSQDILEVEKTLKWWKPRLDSSIINYAGFYNETTKKKIVSTKEHWNGRLILQIQGNKVYIEIDLFNEL